MPSPPWALLVAYLVLQTWLLTAAGCLSVSRLICLLLSLISAALVVSPLLV
jgi:hypothetical protein